MPLLLWCACPSEPPPLTPEQLKAEAEGHYLAAQAAYMKADFAKAHEEFDAVRKLAPGDVRLPAAEGELFLSEGKLAEAVEKYRAALKIDAKRATTYSRLGYILVSKGEREEGVQLLNKALELNPKDFNAWSILADLSYEKKDRDAAVKHALAAAEAAPEKMQGGYVKKAVDWSIEANETDKAIEILQGATARGVKSEDLFEQLGSLLVQKQKFEEAIEAYSKAAAEAPKDPTLWEIVGELHFKQGRPKEAETAYKKSLAIQDRGVVHVAIARMCRANKMADCVAKELDKALRTASGEEPREMLDLADLLESENRKKDSLLILKQLSGEPSELKNLELQLKVAKLGAELKDKEAVAAACERVLKLGKPGTRCP